MNFLCNRTLVAFRFQDKIMIDLLAVLTESKLVSPTANKPKINV